MELSTLQEEQSYETAAASWMDDPSLNNDPTDPQALVNIDAELTEQSMLSVDPPSPGKNVNRSAMDHAAIVKGAASPFSRAGSQPGFSLKDCLGAFQGIDEIARKSNVLEGSVDTSPTQLADDIVKAINGKQQTCARRLCFGRVVHDGFIQFIVHGGRTEAVSAGRWNLFATQATWAKAVHLSEKLIHYGNVTIAWIQRRQLGLAWEFGKEVILDSGLHVYNNPGFIFERVIDRSTDYINHGTLHILHVPKGKLAKVWVNTSNGGRQPRLLREGVHTIDSSLFVFEGFVSMTEQHISHGVLQLLRVPKSHLGKVTDDGQNKFLGQGFHYFESSMFHLAGLAPLHDKMISHGKLHLVRVNKGEVALAWLNNEPLILDSPGTYFYDGESFVYARHQPLSDKIISLGSKKFVQVNEGEVCVSYQHGTLRILQPGRHTLDDASQSVGGFVAQEEGERLLGMYTRALQPALRCCSAPNHRYVEPVNLKI